MKKIINITDEPIQRHTIQFEDDEITLRLRFHPFSTMWAFDVSFKEKETNGVRLAAGVLHIRSRNYAFDFFVTDNSGNGIDPFKADDFSNGRCSLYMLEAADMETIRGGRVPI